MGVAKKRNWAFVIYPESLPANWLETLQLTGLECAISPLHNKDIDPTGEPKKPHYHVIVCYNGPTSINVVKGITDSLNAPIPVALEHVKGYYRYLTHRDNPEKAQYDDKGIQLLNGFNVSNYVEMTRAEVFEIKRNIQSLIREKDILEYSKLLDYLFDAEMLPELEIAQNNTILFNTYLKSRKYKTGQGMRVEVVKVDAVTGEVIG